MTIFKESLLQLAEAKDSSPVPLLSALIVDDEVGNLRVLRSMLGDRFRILEASDGAEALELLAGLAPSELPAIVISDQRMPRMTGVELFERLRETLPSAIRIIITGFVDVGAIVDAINRAGIYKFVVKPFNQNELRLTIDRAIEAYESNRSIDARIEQSRLTDPVTGLGNRAAMIPTLVAAPAVGARDGLLLVDIDRFKAVNDSLGCAAGDALLRGVAAIVRAHCREGELAVRWGDEEFLLHLRVADEAQALERAQQLRAAISAASFDIGGGRTLRCSCTIGAACAPVAAPGAAVDWEQALRAANHDLQQARRGARTTGEPPLADRRQPPGGELRLAQGLPALVESGVVRALREH